MASEAKRDSTSEMNRRYSTFLKNMIDRRFESNADFPKINFYLAKLSTRLKVPIDLDSVKMSFCTAMYRAARETYNRLSEWPAKKSEASDFLSKLKILENLLKELKKFDPERLSEVLTNLPAEIKQYEAHGDRFEEYSWEDVHLRVENEAEELIGLLMQAERGLQSYLADNILPKYVQTQSNRRDNFTYALVHEAASIWRQSIRPDLVRRRDRRDFVGLLGAALDAFGYPRTKEQSDDVWLYQRIPKIYRGARRSAAVIADPARYLPLPGGLIIGATTISARP